MTCTGAEWTRLSESRFSWEGMTQHFYSSSFSSLFPTGIPEQAEHVYDPSIVLNWTKRWYVWKQTETTFSKQCDFLRTTKFMSKFSAKLRALTNWPTFTNDLKDSARWWINRDNKQQATTGKERAFHKSPETFHQNIRWQAEANGGRGQLQGLQFTKTHHIVYVVHKYITLPLCIFGEFLVIDRILFLMTDKTQVNSVITPFSVMQKISENEKITKFSNSVGQMTEMSQREKTALGHEKIHRPLSECHVWTSGVTDGGGKGGESPPWQDKSKNWALFGWHFDI